MSAPNPRPSPRGRAPALLLRALALPELVFVAFVLLLMATSRRLIGRRGGCDGLGGIALFCWCLLITAFFFAAQKFFRQRLVG